MDISGAQLNSAAISAYNAQLQTGTQQNQQSRPAEPPAATPSQPAKAEVTLSREGRERATQPEQPAPQPVVTSAPSVQSSSEAQPAQEERAAAQAREAQVRQQATRADQLSTTSYTARIAAQSYYSVSNF